MRFHCPSPEGARLATSQVVPSPQNTNKKKKLKIAARRTARSHSVLQAEASNPAASAQQIALKLIRAESTASCQPTPPMINGIVTTGNTASHKVTARNPCARLLATTISVALSRVRKSSPRFPSRLSRLRQSAVRKGTRIQIAQKRTQ